MAAIAQLRKLPKDLVMLGNQPAHHLGFLFFVIHCSISGLVVEYIVAIDVTRVRFPADALLRLMRNLGDLSDRSTRAQNNTATAQLLARPTHT